MPLNDFDTDRKLFDMLETGGPLNEAKISEFFKARSKLAREIAEEERKQRIMDLKTASNKNVNPDVRANSARFAGVKIGSGADLDNPEVTKIVNRLAKGSEDPNVPEESTQRDLDDLNQIMIRSVNQGGRRGLAVTGETLAGREAADLRGLESEPFVEEATRGRFFPEQKFGKTDEQIALQRFTQTLEPEITIRSGQAGRDEVAEIRTKNKARLAQFLAQSKPVTLRPGERTVNPRTGKTAALAPSVQPVAKTIEAALLRPGITDKEKADLVSLKQSLKGKGLSGNITLPDGTAISIGDAALQTPTKPFTTQIQKETFSAQKGLGELIALRAKITPESFGVTSSLQKGVQEAFEFFLPGSTPKGVAKPIRNRDRFFRQAEEAFALRVKELTGVQFGEKEAQRLKKSFPNAEDNFAEFQNKVDDLTDSYIRAIARLKRFGNPTDRNIVKSIANSVPLGEITPEEVNSVRAEFGLDVAGTVAAPQVTGSKASSTTQGAAGNNPIPPDVAAKIFQAVGGDANLARQTARSMGYTF